MAIRASLLAPCPSRTHYPDCALRSRCLDFNQECEHLYLSAFGHNPFILIYNAFYGSFSKVFEACPVLFTAKVSGILPCDFPVYLSFALLAQSSSARRLGETNSQIWLYEGIAWGGIEFGQGGNGRVLCEADNACLQYTYDAESRCLTTARPNVGQAASNITSGWILERAQKFYDEAEECHNVNWIS